MTIIIALPHKEGVTVGCDGQRTAGDDMVLHDAMKWTVNPQGLHVGLSGSPYVEERVGLFAADTDKPHVFCDRLRSFFLADGRWPPEVKDGLMPWWDLSLLVTDGRQLWEVGGALYPMEITHDQPAAVGAGYKYALGAMYAAQYEVGAQEIPSGVSETVIYESIVERGLEAACHYDRNCGGDLWVETLTP